MGATGRSREQQSALGNADYRPECAIGADASTAKTPVSLTELGSSFAAVSLGGLDEDRSRGAGALSVNLALADRPGVKCRCARTQSLLTRSMARTPRARGGPRASRRPAHGDVINDLLAHPARRRHPRNAEGRHEPRRQAEGVRS